MSANPYDGITVGGKGLKVLRVFGDRNVRIEAVDREGYWRTVDVERADVVDFIEAFARASGIVL